MNNKIGLHSIGHIRSWRKTVLDIYRKAPYASVPVSSSDDVMVTVNIPLDMHIFSILCWNVQVFDEGKAENNLLVNRIIRRVLNALSVDVCVMLETRENPSINLAAVEHGGMGVQNSPEDGPRTVEEIERLAA